MTGQYTKKEKIVKRGPAIWTISFEKFVKKKSPY